MNCTCTPTFRLCYATIDAHQSTCPQYKQPAEHALVKTSPPPVTLEEEEAKRRGLKKVRKWRDVMPGCYIVVAGKEVWFCETEGEQRKLNL